MEEDVLTFDHWEIIANDKEGRRPAWLHLDGVGDVWEGAFGWAADPRGLWVGLTFPTKLEAQAYLYRVAGHQVVTA